MSIIGKLLSGGTNDLIKTVGDVGDKLFTSKEEKMQLENELKKAEQQYQLDMKKLSVDEQRLVYGDIDSARKREAAVQTSEYATKLSKNVSPILALGTTLLTFTLFSILIFRSEVFKPEVKEIVLYILGVLSAILTQIYSFYFGSSQGSADKSRQISELHKLAIK